VEKCGRPRQATDNNIIQQIKEVTCMLVNQGKNIDAFLIFVIVNSSKKCFLDRQQCEGNPLLHFYGNTADFNTFYMYIKTKNNKRENIVADPCQQWLRERATM